MFNCVIHVIWAWFVFFVPYEMNESSLVLCAIMYIAWKMHVVLLSSVIVLETHKLKQISSLIVVYGTAQYDQHNNSTFCIRAYMRSYVLIRLLRPVGQPERNWPYTRKSERNATNLQKYYCLFIESKCMRVFDNNNTN